GAEALIRWRHPERGLVPPDRFIPLIEQSGLIDGLGLWVLDDACRQLAEWQRAGRPHYLSINVSGRQIPHGLPPAAVAEALARHGIPASRLALEITEGILLANIGEAQAWLQAVQALGVRVYLDDFGTGYSSLSYLNRFPLDTLKIDRSFVQDMATGNNAHSLVIAIVAMARSVGLQVVAEGVETAGQLEILSAIGCQYAQGYYLSRPVTAADFPEVASEIDRRLATPGA
ncbi:MAG TPA: EAL domain-containing protein, partial [Azonexus sp.]|nr:EAL domain-containing protein [Azonexus sp.]